MNRFSAPTLMTVVFLMTSPRLALAQGQNLECDLYATFHTPSGHARVVQMREGQWGVALNQNTFPVTLNGIGNSPTGLIGVTSGTMYSLDLNSGAIAHFATSDMTDGGDLSNGLFYAARGIAAVSIPLSQMTGTFSSQVVGQLPQGVQILDLAVSGNLMFIAGVSTANTTGPASLYVQDISVPNSSPLLVGNMGVRTPGIAVGKYAVYVLGQNGNLYVVDEKQGITQLIPGSNLMNAGEKGFDLATKCFAVSVSVKGRFLANAKATNQGQYVFVKEPSMRYSGQTYTVPLPLGVNMGGLATVSGAYTSTCAALTQYVVQLNSKIQFGQLTAIARNELDGLCRVSNPTSTFGDKPLVVGACQDLLANPLPLQPALYELEVPCQ